MIKFVQCRKCYGKNGKVLPPGFISKIVKAKDGVTDVEVAEECECHKKWKAKVTLISKLEKANIPTSVADISIDSYKGNKSIANVERIKTYVSKYISCKDEMIQMKLAQSSIYMYGINGTQKTTLAWWAAKELISAGKSVHYILMNDLIKLLQKADRDENAKYKIDKMSDVDLLIIDESFDKGKITLYSTGWQMSYIDTFLRSRLQSKNKGIMFVSNVSPEDITENKFEYAIQDLVIRKTHGNVMKFEDRYMDEVANIDVENLF